MINLDKAILATEWMNNFEASKGDYSQIRRLDNIHTEEVKKLPKEEKEEHKTFWRKYFWKF